MFFSDEIGFAFKISALLATILLVVFAVFMIIRSIAKDKAEGTPTQIAIKAFKTLLMFFLVPVVVIAFMTLGNAFVRALYDATMQTSSTPGAFLFSMFAADGGMDAQYVELFKIGEGQWDYTNTSLVSTYMPLSDFPFIFSWIAGLVVLFGVGGSMLIFVDRVLSIVILYIAAPISLSTSVLDDGARFKLWRDQFLSKFIMGYGMIIAINIYALVCGVIMKPGFAFFPGDDLGTKFLDLIMKLLIMGGGALTMQKSMALIGNLVSAGAGSNEIRDNALSAGKLAGMAGGVAKMVGKSALGAASYLSGARAIKSILGDSLSLQSRHLGGRLLNGLGLGGGGGGGRGNKGDKDPDGKSGAANNEKANYGSNPKSTKNAINGEGFKTSFKRSNTNNDKPNQNKDNMVSKTIGNDSTTKESKQPKENEKEDKKQ